MSDEFRYVLHRTGSGTIELIDTLDGCYVFMGLDDVLAIGLKRSDVEELKKILDEVLKKP